MFVLIALTLLAHFEAFKRVSYFQRLDGHTLISAKKSLVLNEKREYSKNTERPTRSTGSRSPSSDGIRQARISRNIRDELAMIISEGDIKAVNYPSEELLRRTSITDVDISPDLSFAKVSISVLGNSVEKRQIFVWLCENVGQVRYSLAKRVKVSFPSYETRSKNIKNLTTSLNYST